MPSPRRDRVRRGAKPKERRHQGKVLTALRERMDLSMQQLADQLDLPKSVIAKAEAAGATSGYSAFLLQDWAQAAVLKLPVDERSAYEISARQLVRRRKH